VKLYLYESHVSLFAGFELVEHDVERSIVEHEIDFILVKFADHGQGHVVVGVNEHQVLNEQNVDDVTPVSVEDGDSRVTLIANLGNCFKVENRLDAEEVSVVQRGHHASDCLLLVGQRPCHNVHLFFLQIVDIPVQKEIKLMTWRNNVKASEEVIKPAIPFESK